MDGFFARFFASVKSGNLADLICPDCSRIEVLNEWRALNTTDVKVTQMPVLGVLNR